MNIPYRTRQALKRLVVAVFVIALAAALLWLCWVLWLGRFVVYTREGAVIDMDRSSADLSGVLAEPPQDGSGVKIYYNEGDDTINTSTELAHVIGYYIDQRMLEMEMDSIRGQIEALPRGTPVMIDLKNSAGSFFYNSSVSRRRQSSIDTAKVDELIAFLDKSGMYTIARVASLRDYEFGLNNVPCGIHHTSLMYLWQDDGGCYWLDPTKQGTMTYLTSIANELKAKGFDEVVFSEFRIPTAEKAVFQGDRIAALQTAAQALISTCGSDSFAVSFAAPLGFMLPQGNSRLYVENAEPAEAETIAQTVLDNAGVTDTTVELVFITALHDTRFDEYGVLRPLSAADAVQTDNKNP